jgi:2-phosphosulfolactate phosphatase
VQQARQLQEPADILGGERFCKKIPGFDYGNSPFEYLSADIQGKRLIITTTNGTRAIQKSQKASELIAGSIINANACTKALLELKRDVVIVCAGTQNQFSLEDGLCAGLIIDELVNLGEESMRMNDFGMAMQHTYGYVKNHLEEALLSCANGKKLCKMGLQEDVLYCAKLNQTAVVPIVRDHRIVPFHGFQ